MTAAENHYIAVMIGTLRTADDECYQQVATVALCWQRGTRPQ